MELHNIGEVDFDHLIWTDYDVIFLASGFEARSIHLLGKIPKEHRFKCVVLGFHPKEDVLSRHENEETYLASELAPLLCPDLSDYEGIIKKALQSAAVLSIQKTLRIFVDYSVMTRAWYGYMLTWLKYSGEVLEADVDFAYVHGSYEGDFVAFQIDETQALAGFEGASAGTRRTVALYGLGYDKYATLAVHEIIQPDSFHCYLAADENDDGPAKLVAQENHQIIELSGHPPLILPLCDLGVIVAKLTDLVDEVSRADEVLAVAMGPKTHILGTLLVGHRREKLTCIHTLGAREKPVQVTANGRISCWRIQYR